MSVKKDIPFHFEFCILAWITIYYVKLRLIPHLLNLKYECVT